MDWWAKDETGQALSCDDSALALLQRMRDLLMDARQILD